MGKGFREGVPPFLISDFVLQDTKKDFLPVLSKLSQVSMVKISQMSEMWFP